MIFSLLSFHHLHTFIHSPFCNHFSVILVVVVVVVDENTSSNAQTFEKPFGPFKQTLPRFCSHRDWAFLFFFCCFSWWRFPTNIFVSFSILSITRIFNFGRICNVFLSCWHNCREAGRHTNSTTDGRMMPSAKEVNIFAKCMYRHMCVYLPTWMYFKNLWCWRRPIVGNAVSKSKLALLDDLRYQITMGELWGGMHDDWVIP